ncbi:MAG: YdcF family protein [Flammeovirgaceae bacterium]|nr:YdcF family protein [Flammeovirgaceae bacterium]
MPFTWVFIFLLLALFLKRTVLARRFLWLAMISLYFFSNPTISNSLMLWWEVPPTPLAEIKNTYDIGIVLSGVMNVHKSPHDRFYTNKGADRVLHAALLYQRGIIKKILVTGSYVKLSGDVKDEAASMKELLLLCGVPEEAIILENKARNTRENALFSAEIIRREYPTASLMLITSAFHMRRAVACFEKVGLHVTPFSADMSTWDTDISLMSLLVPSENSFANFNKLVHELVGYAVYKIVGYA